MRFRLASKLGEMSGQSLVELALVLPILVTLALGIFDLSRAIQANNIITNMSREGASLAARSTIAPQDIMDSLAATAQPLAMTTNGAIYITQVTKTNGVSTVQQPQNVWRNTTDEFLNSRINQGDVKATLGGIDSTMKEGDSVYISEVIYNYNFMFGAYSPYLYSITIL